ncbi:MAG TPA: hypothetical protein VNO81_08935, partial [Candidatus Nitrosotenuis sp.]|nr:hypothetical protein [Candidatus Nitrosotenuis sp.]
MAPQPSLHDRLVRSIAEGAPEAASLAREQARQIGTVYRQMEAVVRGGEAAPPFLQGASEALQAMDSYLK